LEKSLVELKINHWLSSHSHPCFSRVTSNGDELKENV